MVDFSIIAQDPATRSLVQDGLLERAFRDALYPNLLFRSMVDPEQWVQNTGDRQIFTGEGLYKKSTRALKPGFDPVPTTRQKEQWEAVIQRYAWTADTPMATAALAPVNLFYQDAKAVGMVAGQSLNACVRNRMYNAAEAGNTVADGTQGSSTTIRVKRLNGFTRARRPDLAAGSPVQFQAVSSSNPLPVIFTASTARNVTGFSPDNPGDEFGPGTITIDVAIAVTDRDAIRAVNRSSVTWVGGGTKVDDIGNTDLLTLQAVRDTIANLRQNNVPTFPDGMYYAHIDPIAEGQLFADQELQRLNTSLPDYAMYADFAAGKILGTAFLRNNECPVLSTVANGDGAYSLDDNFAGEMWNTGVSTGTPLHRTIIAGYGGVKEYWLDFHGLVSDAGLQGKTAEPRITNNGIDVLTDRITLVIRSPQNRVGDLPTTTAVFHGDWPVRTDSATGDASAFKRFREIVSGQA